MNYEWLVLAFKSNAPAQRVKFCGNPQLKLMLSLEDLRQDWCSNSHETYIKDDPKENKNVGLEACRTLNGSESRALQDRYQGWKLFLSKLQQLLVPDVLQCKRPAFSSSYTESKLSGKLTARAQRHMYLDTLFYIRQPPRELRRSRAHPVAEAGSPADGDKQVPRMGHSFSQAPAWGGASDPTQGSVSRSE